MKSVMLSIKPKWCEMIARGQKTIEVRKSRPKLEAPFKCYIYCTQARIPIRDSGRILMYEDDLALTNRWDQGKLVENPCGAMMEGEFFLNGKVIGEFVCNKIDKIDVIDDEFMTYIQVNQKADMFVTQETCLEIDGLQKYLNNNKTGYGWHISDLVIYNKPKELSEYKIKRPPQSWCYVEEVGE